MRRLLVMVLVMAALFSVVLLPQASADPAVVFTWGQGTSTCSATGFGGSYEGVASTTVFKDGSLVLVQCNAKLVSGTPVSSTQVIRSGNCTDVFTAAGSTTFTCQKS